MYDRILVPVDTDPTGHPAIEEGVELARRHDATITVIHVVRTERIASVPMESSWAGVTTMARREGESVIEAAAALDEDLDIPIEPVLREGTPSREIVHVARDLDCDLIVMATSGREGLNRLLLGSVTECVVRQSTVPVLTVRRQTDTSSEDSAADANVTG